jgi:hypothetical protein
MKECPPVKPGASSLVGSVSGYPGGLNGSTQHHLEVRLQRFQQLKSFASVDSNGTLPCLVLIEYTRADRFSRGKYVGSTACSAYRRSEVLVRHMSGYPINQELTQNSLKIKVSAILFSSSTRRGCGEPFGAYRTRVIGGIAAKRESRSPTPEQTTGEQHMNTVVLPTKTGHLR